MTERSAVARIDVTGNAVPELKKVEQGVAATGKAAATTSNQIKRTGAALDGTAKKAAESTNRIERAGRATATLDSALKKTAVAAKSNQKAVASMSWETANASKSIAKYAVNTVTATKRLEGYKRGVEGAFGAVRQFSNSRFPAPNLTVWQRLAREIRAAVTASRDYSKTLGRSDVTGVMRGGSRIAGAALGVGGFALDQSRQAASALGIAGRDQLANQYADFDVAFARLSNQAGLDAAGKDRLREQVLHAARSNMQDPSEVLAAMSEAQNRFSQLDFFANNANRFAAAATALGTPMQDIVGAVGEFQRQLGVTAEQVPELIGMLTDASAKGSIEFSDISSEFATTIGSFARVTGAHGMEGARQFVGMAQVLGAGGAGGAGSAVLAQNLLSKFANADVQKALRRAGIRTTEQVQNADGTRSQRFVGIDSIVSQLRNDRRHRFVSADGQVNQTALQGILGADMQANQALGILMTEAGKGNTVQNIVGDASTANASAAAGNATIANTNRDIRNSAGGGVMRARTEAQANFLENGEQAVRTLTAVARASSSLETKFPQVAFAADTVRSAFSALTGALGSLNLAGLGGSAAAAGGTAGAAGTAAAAGGAGVLGKVGGAIAALGMGQLAAHATLGLQDQFGDGHASERWNNFWSGDWSLNGTGMFGRDAPTTSARMSASDRRQFWASLSSPEATAGGSATASAAAPAGAAPVGDAANTQATAANTQALNRLADAMQGGGGGGNSNPANVR